MNVYAIRPQVPAQSRRWLLLAPLLLVAMVLFLNANQAAFAAAAPTVGSVLPGSGPDTGGTAVVIKGTGFTGATAVTIGGAAATGVSVTNDQSINATTPAHTAGAVTISVTTPSGTGTSSGPVFTYISSIPPSVTSVNPTSGPTTGGTSVTITGSGFTGATSVSFGANPAAFTVINNNSISATSPLAAVAGAVGVTVVTPAGSSLSGVLFTYTAPPPPPPAQPVVTVVSPGSGPTTGGTTVFISGTGFTGATSVLFGTLSAGFSVNSDIQITATSPAGAAETANIFVTGPGGTSTAVAADQFTWLAPSLPTISGLSPAVGPTTGGNAVIISGNGFTGVTSVMFGGAAAVFTFNSGAQITATAPAEAAGTVNVTVTTPAGTSSIVPSDQYTYGSVGVPTVLALNPPSGTTSGGTPVIITGTNFTGATSVTFNGASAVFTVNSGTQITATTPAGVLGVATVVVTTPGGTSVGGATYTYTTGAGLPVVTFISPATGSTAGGTSVTITGSLFTGVTGVSFGGTPAFYTFNGDTQITATSPAGAAGTVQVTVTTPAGTSVVSAQGYFTYSSVVGGVPVIFGLNPAGGPTSGGTQVSITGSGFTGTTQVLFGGSPAGFAFVSDAQLNVTSPVGAAGSVSVTVSNASGTSAPGLFTYTGTTTGGAPGVTGLTPGSGPVSGGTSVIIYGSGFTGATSVIFGSSSASFVVNSDSQITATSPSGVIGTVTVTVSGPGGPGTTATTFTYTASSSAPVITQLSPATGPSTGGTTVVISGSGFTGATSVLFGASSAAFTPNSDTQVTATSPTGSAGVVMVTVATAGGTSAGFAYTYTGTTNVPIVAALNPAAGPASGGTSVVISGSGFTGATSVRFGGVGATFSVNSDTQITATTPAGSAGTVTAIVTAPGGSSAGTASSSFTYNSTSNLCPLIPLWVNDLAYGSPGGGFYWDGGVSGEVWTPARGWHYFSPQPPRPSPQPLWVDALTYGSIGGGFWWDPVSDQVWTGERGWHQYSPTGCIAR